MPCCSQRETVCCAFWRWPPLIEGSISPGRWWTLINVGKDITVTTYRESDANGIAARAFYKHLGFSEGKLTEEFGCPVQEFVLKR